MTKPSWLDRRIAKSGPYLTLCLSEQEFRDTLAHCKITDRIDWVSSGADATMHTLDHESGDLVCIVCLRDYAGRDPVEVAGMLVHEAVHVWQRYADAMGERHPGSEQEAYAIQAIAQELMAEFARRMK